MSGITFSACVAFEDEDDENDDDDHLGWSEREIIFSGYASLFVMNILIHILFGTGVTGLYDDDYGDDNDSCIIYRASVIMPVRCPVGHSLYKLLIKLLLA